MPAACRRIPRLKNGCGNREGEDFPRKTATDKKTRFFYAQHETMPMKIKKVLVAFTPKEVQQILSIELDVDRDKAFYFIKNVLSKRVEKQL